MSIRAFQHGFAALLVTAGFTAMALAAPDPSAGDPSQPQPLAPKAKRKAPNRGKRKDPVKARAALKEKRGKELAQKLDFGLRLIKPVEQGKPNKDAYHYFARHSCTFTASTCKMSCTAKNMHSSDGLPKVTVDFDVSRVNAGASTTQEKFDGAWIMAPGSQQADTGRFLRVNYPASHNFALSLSSRFGAPDIVLTTKQRPRPGCHGWECNDAYKTQRLKYAELYLMKHQKREDAKELARRFSEVTKLCLPPPKKGGKG